MVQDRSDEPAAVAEDAGGLGDALVDDLDSGFAEVVRAYERIVYTVALRLRPWLLTIVRNTARNRARDARRRPAPPPSGERGEEAAGGSSVEEQVEQNEAQRRLGALLAQLPDVQRLAVVLRHVVGLPTAEVAEVLGCPEGTAKSHVSRGLRRLRVLALESGKGVRSW